MFGRMPEADLHQFVVSLESLSGIDQLAPPSFENVHLERHDECARTGCRDDVDPSQVREREPDDDSLARLEAHAAYLEWTEVKKVQLRGLGRPRSRASWGAPGRRSRLRPDLLS